MAVTFAQGLINLINGHSTVGKLTRCDRLADARCTAGAVVVAEAVEQILMAFMLLASAIAMELSK
jgi:hypothetical protein